MLLKKGIVTWRYNHMVERWFIEIDWYKHLRKNQRFNIQVSEVWSKNFNKILTSITWGLSSVISIKLPMDMVLSSNLALLVYNYSRSMNLYVLLVVKHYVNSDFISCLHFPSLSNYSSFLVVASRGCCFQPLISKHVMFFDLVCQSSLH